MSRFLLDTNILSNAVKLIPSKPLADWLAGQQNESLFIASLTFAEIQRGILEKPPGRKRKQLEEWFNGPEGPASLFFGRILPFDLRAGLFWARLMADGTAAGKPRSALDTVIAATALANDCVLVTDNERDLPGMTIINLIRPSTTSGSSTP